MATPKWLIFCAAVPSSVDPLFFLFLGGIDAIREIGLGCPGVGERLALGPLAQLLEPKASVFHFQLIVIK